MLKQHNVTGKTHMTALKRCGSGKFATQKSEQIKEKTGENLSIFTGLVELVAGLEPATC